MNIDDTELFRIKRNIIKKLYAKKAFRKGHLLFDMSEIALDASCAALAYNQDEQFLSMLKNTATCSVLQCCVFDTLKSGIPKHLERFVGAVLEQLIKDGLVVTYGKTKYGNAYQLNVKKLKEIEEIIFQR